MYTERRVELIVCRLQQSERCIVHALRAITMMHASPPLKKIGILILMAGGIA